MHGHWFSKSTGATSGYDINGPHRSERVTPDRALLMFKVDFFYVYIVKICLIVLHSHGLQYRHIRMLHQIHIYVAHI